MVVGKKKIPTTESLARSGFAVCVTKTPMASAIEVTQAIISVLSQFNSIRQLVPIKHRVLLILGASIFGTLILSMDLVCRLTRNLFGA